MHCDFYGRIAVSVSFLRNQTDDAINYSILFLKAEENTRFVMKSSLAFCHCSLSLVGVKHKIMNNCLHKQEYSSPVAGLEQWTVCCVTFSIIKTCSCLKIIYKDEKITYCKNKSTFIRK